MVAIILRTFLLVVNGYFWGLTRFYGKIYSVTMQEENKGIIYLSPKEAAELLGLSENTISRYLNYADNPLPSYKISDKTIRIRKDELIKWVEEKFKRGEE